MDTDSLDTPKANKKTLILARHGEKLEMASHDYERPLNKKGIHQSHFVANQLILRGIHPDFVLHSGSPRTRQTAEEIESQYSYPFKKVDCGTELYLAASPRDMLTAMAGYLPDTAQNVLVVGHNPGICRLVHHLAQNDPAQLLAALKNDFPSSTTCVFEVSCDEWWQISPANCKLHFLTSGDGFIRTHPTYIPNRTP
ncbi:MAG: histidine phosphatase family protein [Pseudobdellovibrionaceae bacterium]|jgi:phosphohistidine phosphatase|nr:histidine phosphatase family protein [Pseudobdellovibrionaceae bacterium]